MPLDQTPFLTGPPRVVCVVQASADHDLVVTYSTQLLDGPGTEVFFETVWKGVVEAITGPSPRALPGPVPPATPKKTPKIR